jgi:uncharacterized protein
VERVLIAGVSTRAAAESAARSGFVVTAIDAFGDLDQHPAVRVASLESAFTAGAAARATRTVECDAVVYLASFENHPVAISALAEGRALWGNPPDVIRRVRDPLLLAEALRQRGIAGPQVRLKSDPTSKTDWLVKPLASGGGQRIRRWQRGDALPRGCYLQELIDGPPASVVFVAAGGRAVSLGISKQLVGEQAFGASGYQYCGNILADEDVALVETAGALARAVTEEFGLVGVNGIDFIVRDGVPYATEVNPRWCASMELVERAYGIPVLAAHAEACATGLLPVLDMRARADAGRQRPAAFGKAVVYAQRDVVIGDTHAWLSGEDIRDIPHPGEHIRAGRPVCTVFATGRNSGMCHQALVSCAAQIHAQLDAWDRGTA